MDEQLITKKELKRKKRRRIRRKIFFAFCTLLILTLWIFNFHCAVKGVPQWLLKSITTPLKEMGYHLKAKQVFFSFTEGLNVKDLNYFSEYSGIKLAIPEFSVDLYPSEIFKGVCIPIQLQIENGTARLPMLPETGAEGKMDCLDIQKLNARIKGKTGLLKVEKASAEIGNIHVDMEGSINNFLHIIVENVFKDFWERNKAGKKWKNKKYPYGIMQVFPIEIREKFVQAYHRFQELKMKGNPECSARFYVDLNDFKSCNIEADVRLPEFRFQNMRFLEIKEHISLSNGVLELKEVNLDLGNHSSLTASGTYYDEGEIFSGNINGKCHISDLIHLVGKGLSDEIQKHVTFEDQLISFNGQLEHFSVSGNRYKGNIDLTLPRITVDGVVMQNVKLLVHADEKQLRGEIKQAELTGGSISGSFTINNTGSILCQLRGKALLSAFQETFPDEINTFYRKQISCNNEKEAPVSFDGTFRSDSRKLKRYSGTVSILYPHICLNNEKIQNIIADMEFSPDMINISRITATVGDDSRVSGSIKVNLLNNQIAAKMVASGIPGHLAKTFDLILGTDSLTSLAKDISSPDKKGIAETDLELFAKYGQKMFYQISGNVVMRNPTYCGIPFQYGAARFITDSSNRLVIPDLILKSKEGSMQLQSIYDTDYDKIDILHFNLKSNIKGNDLLTIFCEGYDPVLVDFPYPINVSANGVIDYIDQKKTVIRASVQNGTCTFAGAKVSNIDAVLNVKDEELFFKDAAMAFSKGVCKADFKYHFGTGKGSFRQTLEGADLLEVVRQFEATKFVPSGTGNGKLDFQSRGTFESKNESDVAIYGTGKLDLNGDDLWNIPLMKDFLKYISNAWSMLGSGAGITRISCDILFKGEKAVIDKVKANGSFVSMNADGEFFWNTGEYNVNVYAELLKSALPFEIASQILKPVSWMLKKNFKGKYAVPSGKQ